MISSSKTKSLVPIIILTGLAVISFINHSRSGNLKAGIIIGTSFIAISLIPWWIFLKYDDELHRKRIKFSLVFGVITGGIVFVCGFFGPMIFMPGANQGPLLGIILGPLAFLGGFLLGAIISMFNYRRTV